jgi:hypothetical protein
MRKAAAILIFAALLWSAWWLVAALGVRSGIAAWFDAQAARGWQADYAAAESAGYPSQVVTTLSAPALADPATGVAWQADRLVLQSPAIWPADVTLRFPDTPQRLSHWGETVTLVAADMTAALQLDHGLALRVDMAKVRAGPWTMTREDRPLARAEGLSFTMQARDEPAVYDITAELPGLVPGDRLREVAAISDELPDRLDALKLRGRVRFDKPWDLGALEEARPQPRAIDLDLLEARWGALRILAAGQVEVAADGTPEGQVTLKADNWRDMLAMARRSGALPPDLAAPAARALELLAGIGGNPDALDVTLTLRGGYIAVGPVPIAPAPRLLLR